MKFRKSRLGLSLAVVSVAAMTIAGCTSAEPAGELPPYIKWVTAGDPMNTGLNAQFASSLSATTFSSQILEPLIFASGDGELSPGLAESWELSDDGLELVLEIREGVTWHDGEPFTPEDVEFNLEEIVPLSIYGAPFAERISSVDVDGQTVTVELSEPFGPILETIAEQYILPRHLYEGTDYVTNPANYEDIIGTGPMMFGSYEPGVEVVLVKNPDYWGGEVQVERAIFAQIVDINTRTEALFAGELDEAQVPASALARVGQSDFTELRTSGYYPSLIHMFFNTRSPYLADPAVRSALFAALDREAMAETALYGIGGEASNGFFPDAFDWAQSDEVDFAADFPRDIDAINETLDEAGFPRGADGLRFTLKLRYVASLEDLVAIGGLMESMFDEIGVGLDIQATSASIYQEGLYNTGDYDLAMTRMTLGPDPGVGLTRWFACNESNALAANPTGLCDAEIDAAIDAALTAVDRDERAERYQEMQERAEELMYYVPLFWYYNANPVVNTTRWEGAGPQEYRDRLSWLTMSPR